MPDASARGKNTLTENNFADEENLNLSCNTGKLPHVDYTTKSTVKQVNMLACA